MREYLAIRAVKLLIPVVAYIVMAACGARSEQISGSGLVGTFVVPESLFSAIRFVESTDGKFTTGDDGTSVGPYQISQSYLDDTGLGYTLEDMKDDLKARRAMVAYWTRYAPRDRPITCEILARIHNGGPKGYLSESTKGYWLRVKSRM